VVRAVVEVDDLAAGVVVVVTVAALVVVVADAVVVVVFAAAVVGVEEPPSTATRCAFEGGSGIFVPATTNAMVIIEPLARCTFEGSLAATRVPLPFALGHCSMRS
jgi:hypothetical protein